jgi:UDP-glucose:glycoprotein glucosyltransferase
MFFLFLPSLFPISQSTFRPDHAVSLGVVAPWCGVPLFDQVLAFLTDSSVTAARQFVRVCLSSFAQINSEPFILATAKRLHPSAHAMLEAKVELGFYLPRIEMFREIARSMSGSNPSALIVVSKGGRPELPIEDEYEFHDQNSTSFDFDLAFGNSKVYVYADLQNRKAAAIVLKLIESGVQFVLRPISKTDGFGIPLRGFGIEMRPFKYSMEYGVKDSAILMGENQTISVNDLTVGGINGIPRDYVDITTVDRFGPRFTAWLASRGKDAVPSVLKDLTANFPLFLPEIAETAWTMESFKHWQILDRSVAVSSRMLVNGRPLDSSRLDVFTLLEAIAKEQNFLSFLRASGISMARIRQLEASIETEKPFLLDYESDFITYYNNIETDPEYKDWSSRTDDLFSPFLMGPPQIRKNLLTVVLYCDPLSRAGSSLMMLHKIVSDQAPIRLGIVPVFSLGNPLSRKVAFAFYHIAISSPKKAVRFLVRAMALGGFDEDGNLLPPSETDFATAFQEFCEAGFSWRRLPELFDIWSTEYKMMEGVKALLKRSGITSPSLVVNGKVESLEGEMAYEAIQNSFQEVIMLIRSKNLRDLDTVSISDLLAGRYVVLPTFNAKILTPRPRGLAIREKPLSKMNEIATLLGRIEWSGQSPARIFYILYSEDEEQIAAFRQFMNASHDTPSEFALNPPQRLLAPDQDGLIVNGRIFTDVNLTVGLPLIELIANATLPRFSDGSPTEARLLSCLRVDRQASPQERSRERDNALWRENNPLIYVSSNEAEITLDLTIDPFTREFQRIAGMIDYVDSLGLAKVRMAIVPPAIIPDLPATLTAYYRSAISQDRAVFTFLNDTTTYSAMPDMPASWVFESMYAAVDLDNILLSELSPSVHNGTYVLTNVMLEGLCFAGEEYAEGAELALLDGRGTRVSDTIVMRSSGYWQLPANPGVWDIDLGGQRSRTIYEMQPTELTVHSFAQRMFAVFVDVRPGMEGMRVYNLTISDTSNTTRVDVFSVASGHLYERLLKIMMLAVRRRSAFSVKFWIIKAFLSPQFKATLPIMAARYNFSYQLVSYKWPSWLRPQHEKQRIIWGNKILFLDVLFPLELERVIYIDSDQIVRTDLIELMRMDFGDAPYAFTPFCDSRTDTEPFRFWKRGYWKEHLGPAKYHISALFAINLQRFRKMAAGDWIRYYYQQLSSDPGSLANLDQDLPNYAQSQIPIFSLPQNWLWCETWCSRETLKDAKTIDLCNNPLTKHPKLFVAQTMIDEWPGLDEEVRNISAGPDEYQKFFFGNRTLP